MDSANIYFGAPYAKPCDKRWIKNSKQVVQWLRLHDSTAGEVGSIPGWGTKILPAIRQGKKKEPNPPGNKNNQGQGFPGGSVVKNLPANVGDTGPIPDPGRSHMPQRN